MRLISNYEIATGVNERRRRRRQRRMQRQSKDVFHTSLIKTKIPVGIAMLDVEQKEQLTKWVSWGSLSDYTEQVQQCESLIS